ncbi:golgin subfamily A member 7-like isoform X2 [Liolophura sinensis]
MDELSRISTAHCSKIFVHRDFSEGTSVRFQTKFPQDLDGRIDRAAFDRTVSRINEIFVKAESLGGRTYCESCMACLTAYLSYLCVDTYYEKCLKEISRFIEEQNKTVYVPRGLMLVDPVERGLRVLEICVLQDQGPR